MGRDLWCPPVPRSSFLFHQREAEYEPCFVVTNKPKPTSRLNIYFNNSYAFLIEVVGKKQSS